jgi:(p)ppGpp synthase/HD superfamily hydrolase
VPDKVDRGYAHTNIQLYQQLQGEGYSIEEVGRVCQGYELARELFSCQYRPSGATFISHLVGTASILGTLRVPCEVVIAGLLHAAYPHGDFGEVRTGISDHKRRKVRVVIGEIAEAYIANYAMRKWDEQAILHHSQNLSNLSSIERNVLIMRLANELEDHLDLGILYCFNALNRQKSLQGNYSILVELATSLGYPTLGEEFHRIFHPLLHHPIPVGLTPLNAKKGVMLRIPLSYRQRLPHHLFKWLLGKWDGLRSVIIDLRTMLYCKAKRFHALVTK